MAMDMLRSCYRSRMRLYTDRPDVLTPGRWYFCPPGAQWLPLQHRFASQRWDTKFNVGDPDVGEVRGSLGWFSGSPPPGLTGQHYCGAPEVWLNGLPYDQRPGLVVGPDGIPTCCKPPVVYTLDVAFELEELAGRQDLEWVLELHWIPDVTPYDLDLVLELTWTEPPALAFMLELEWQEDVEVNAAELLLELEWAAPGESTAGEFALELTWDAPSRNIVVNCLGCVEAPMKWNLSASGFSGVATVFNGDFVLTHVGGCLWQSPFASVDDPHWNLLVSGPGTWSLDAVWNDGGTTRLARWSQDSGAWNCTGPNTLDRGPFFLNMPRPAASQTLTPAM